MESNWRPYRFGHFNGTAKIWEAVPWDQLEAIGDSKTPVEEKLRRWRERRDLGPVNGESRPNQ